MKKKSNPEPKRALSVVLEKRYLDALDELKEVLVRPTATDVVRFLIADGAKKFLPQGSTIELSAKRGATTTTER
jgi:hypothetical protein